MGPAVWDSLRDSSIPSVVYLCAKLLAGIIRRIRVSVIKIC